MNGRIVGSGDTGQQLWRDGRVGFLDEFTQKGADSFNTEDRMVKFISFADNKKRLCKIVLRLHRESFSKIRVCGLFYLDAAFQLSLMSLLTNYIVVLLQFAFL